MGIQGGGKKYGGGGVANRPPQEKLNVLSTMNV